MPLVSCTGCRSPEGVNVGGEGCFSVAAGCVALLGTVDGVASVILRSPLFVGVFNNRFDPKELPDSTVELRASVGRVKIFFRFPIMPAGFAEGLRTFPALTRPVKIGIPPGEVAAGAVLTLEVGFALSKLPDDPAGDFALFEAFPPAASATERRRGSDSDALLSLLFAVISDSNLDAGRFSSAERIRAPAAKLEAEPGAVTSSAFFTVAEAGAVLGTFEVETEVVPRVSTFEAPSREAASVAGTVCVPDVELLCR